MTSGIPSCTPTDSLGSGSTGEVYSVSENAGAVLKQYSAISVDRALLARSFRGRSRMPTREGIESVLDYSLDSSPAAALFEKVPGPTMEDIGTLRESAA